ncbi:glucocorticoid receptor-like (DNA-binding domain), partial [Karstenula rhodostoma CBS 690.94]
MYALDGDEAPHWRVEHATSGMSTCNQAQCKSKGIKIEKGELRVGTHTWHTVEEKYFWAWRHWRCATPHQIRGLQSISNSELAKVPGYERISEESREQLKLALEEGKVNDKDFKDIRPDLVKGGGYMGEIRDAVGYKVDVSPSARAGCRAAACKEQGNKIVKGELRLGILRLFDGEHESYVYKHWKCISKYDLSAIEEHAQHDTFNGIDSLPKDYEAVVLESLEKGEVIVPPKLDVPAPANKSRAK